MRVLLLVVDSAADCVFIGCEEDAVFSNRGSAGDFSFVAGCLVPGDW